MYFSCLRAARAQQPADAEHRADHQQGGTDEDRHGEILPVELGHAWASRPRAGMRCRCGGWISGAA